ncbi:MAG: hypothetical protein R3D27_02110 [Hyphomicrobiaceae bacterium]
MLRIIAVILILLAGAKLAVGEYLYRMATQDLVVRAYRDAAVAGCSSTTRLLGLGIDAVGWRMAGDVRLEIGRRDTGVHIWDTGHELWRQRWRDPFLHLTARTGSDSITCTYDVLRGMAAVRRG